MIIFAYSKYVLLINLSLVHPRDFGYVGLNWRDFGVHGLVGI